MGKDSTTVECVTEKVFVNTIDEKTSVESVVVGADVVPMGSLSIFVECVTVKHTVHTINGKIVAKSVVGPDVVGVGK